MESPKAQSQEPLQITAITNEHQEMILVGEINQLQKQVDSGQEKLRKLKMVQLYRKKNDLANLEDLIQKWKTASQEVIVDLQNNLPEPRPTISEMLKSFQIDEGLLNYNQENGDFI
eukprot:gene9754-10751_t